MGRGTSRLETIQEPPVRALEFSIICLVLLASVLRLQEVLHIRWVGAASGKLDGWGWLWASGSWLGWA